MRILRLERLGLAPVGATIRVKQVFVGVFVVHAQQAVRRRGLAVADERKEMHPVVMHSRLLGLLCGTVTGIGAESRAIRDRVPPSVEHLQNIGFGNAYKILSGCGNRSETDL